MIKLCLLGSPRSDLDSANYNLDSRYDPEREKRSGVAGRVARFLRKKRFLQVLCNASILACGSRERVILSTG